MRPGRWWLVGLAGVPLAASLAACRCERGIIDFAVDTFEGWVQRADAVWVGTIERVGKTGTDRTLCVPYRAFSFRVEEVVKGGVERGPVDVRHILTHGEQTFGRSDEGTRLLAVVTRGHALLAVATYQIVEHRGAEWGVRLFSDTSGSDRTDLVRRLRGGKRLRAVDASPLADLVARARDPDRLRREHLGYRELEPSRVRTLPPQTQGP